MTKPVGSADPETVELFTDEPDGPELLLLPPLATLPLPPPLLLPLEEFLEEPTELPPRMYWPGR